MRHRKVNWCDCFQGSEAEYWGKKHPVKMTKKEMEKEFKKIWGSEA